MDNYYDDEDNQQLTSDPSDGTMGDLMRYSDEDSDIKEERPLTFKEKLQVTGIWYRDFGLRAAIELYLPFLKSKPNHNDLF